MYGLQLIAILAVMGGIIAYIGDKLGTKVGKKKLSIFGLRPKHTSILVTIITGILIAGATLGILTVASKDVRTALFGMEALKNELSSLTGEVKQKNSELSASQAALAAKTEEYGVVTQKIKETMSQLTAIAKELSEVTAERDKTAAALEKVQADYVTAAADLNKSKQEIAALQATKNELDTKVATLNISKETLQQDVNRLNDLTNNLKQSIQVVREGTVAFRAGEILGSGIIQAGSSREEIENYLKQLSYGTNQSIVKRLGISDTNVEVLWLAKAEFEQAVSIAEQSGESVLVRIASSGNIIYGEPVIGNFELYPNRLVYKKGEAIFTDTAEAGRSGHDAEEMVLAFLKKVNSTAVAKGMLADPLEGTVGVISGAQLYDTVNKVRQIGGKVEITAAAKVDTYTMGPLQLSIQVKAAQ